MAEVHDFLKGFHGGRSFGDAVVTKADFDESKHARDDHGKFTAGQAAGAAIATGAAIAGTALAARKGKLGIKALIQSGRAASYLDGMKSGLKHNLPDIFHVAESVGGRAAADSYKATIMSGAEPDSLTHVINHAAVSEAYGNSAGKGMQHAGRIRGAFGKSDTHMGKFDESKHPRDHGEFATKDGDTNTTDKKKARDWKKAQQAGVGPFQALGTVIGGLHGIGRGARVANMLSVGGKTARAIQTVAGAAGGAVIGGAIGGAIGKTLLDSKIQYRDENGRVIKSDNGDLRKFGTYNESDHPRDAHGEWTSKGGGGPASAHVAAGIAAGAAAIGGAYMAARHGRLGAVAQDLAGTAHMAVADAAHQAGGAIGDAASRAGSAVSGAASAAGDRISNAVSNSGIGAGYRSGRAGMSAGEAYGAGGAGAGLGAAAGRAVTGARDFAGTAGMAAQHDVAPRIGAAYQGARQAVGAAGGRLNAAGATARQAVGDAAGRASTGAQRTLGTVMSGARSARAGFNAGNAGRSIAGPQRQAYNTGRQVGAGVAQARSAIGSAYGQARGTVATQANRFDNGYKLARSGLGVSDIANKPIQGFAGRATQIGASAGRTMNAVAPRVQAAGRIAGAVANHAVDATGSAIRTGSNAADRILNAARNPGAAVHGYGERNANISSSPKSLPGFANSSYGRAYYAGRGTQRTYA